MPSDTLIIASAELPESSDSSPIRKTQGAQPGRTSSYSQHGSRDRCRVLVIALSGDTELEIDGN